MAARYYAFIDGEVVGPAEPDVWRKNPRFNPDAQVLKEGTEAWFRAGDLKDFKVAPPPSTPPPRKEIKEIKPVGQGCGMRTYLILLLVILLGVGGYFGYRKVFKIECYRCGGTGTVYATCMVCSGTGLDGSIHMGPCRSCNGLGVNTAAENYCPVCGGSGLVSRPSESPSEALLAIADMIRARNTSALRERVEWSAVVSAAAKAGTGRPLAPQRAELAGTEARNAVLDLISGPQGAGFSALEMEVVEENFDTYIAYPRVRLSVGGSPLPGDLIVGMGVAAGTWKIISVSSEEGSAWYEGLRPAPPSTTTTTSIPMEITMPEPGTSEPAEPSPREDLPVGTLEFGSPVSGRIEETDPSNDHERHYDDYIMEGRVGRTVTIDVISDEIDPLLYVFDPDGEEVGHDDDGGEGNASHYSFEMEKNGDYIARALSYSTRRFGGYRIRLMRGERDNWDGS